MKNLCYMPQAIVACVGFLLAWAAGTGNRAFVSAFTPHCSSLRKNMASSSSSSLSLLSLSAELERSGKGSDSKSQVHASALDRRSVLLGTSSLPFLLQSMAVSAASAQDDSPVSPQDLLSRLRRVPCFAIVDKDGVPYMIVDKGDRGATGYCKWRETLLILYYIITIDEFCAYTKLQFRLTSLSTFSKSFSHFEAH